MSNPKGFMEFDQETPQVRDLAERIQDFKEHELPFNVEKTKNQAARCMDCGVPFCMSGCPLGNMIPNFNDMAHRDNWEEAIRTLHATNNFPEFTGRVCPAPCESACVLGIIEAPVTIKVLENEIADRAFEYDLVIPEPPQQRTDKKVAIVGSGPAGLACAQQLNRAGHLVTVFEKAPQAGGLLLYGIPDYKLPPALVERRVIQLRREGVFFRMGTWVGRGPTFEQLHSEFDAVVLCNGAEKPRELAIPGRQLEGVHLAMDFLPQQTSINLNEPIWNYPDPISAKDKNVIVIGGGDTGSDCIGTSLRQGAKKVTNFEILEKLKGQRPPTNPWPQYDLVYRVSSSMKENFSGGGSTEYTLVTKEFLGKADHLTHVKTCQVKWGDKGFSEVADSTQTWPCDLVLLAMGYTGPVTELLTKQLDVRVDGNGNLDADQETKMTSVEGVFVAGDCRRGQSLIVWAIAEGRDTAASVDSWLTGAPSRLPRVRTTPYAY